MPSEPMRQRRRPLQEVRRRAETERIQAHTSAIADLVGMPFASLPTAAAGQAGGQADQGHGKVTEARGRRWDLVDRLRGGRGRGRMSLCLCSPSVQARVVLARRPRSSVLVSLALSVSIVLFACALRKRSNGAIHSSRFRGSPAMSRDPAAAAPAAYYVAAACPGSSCASASAPARSSRMAGRPDRQPEPRPGNAETK